jgi:hypothetical protein
MSKLTESILGTFGNQPNSGSARKYTAFNFVVMVDVIHLVVLGYVIWGKDIEKIRIGFKLLETLFYIDCLMILLMLSIVTFEQIIKLKNGKKDETPTQ